MTYADIYKKFLIEYDKDAATTSYPSLTHTEVANILDKAYLALIAQKLTGTNSRGAVFEGDVKAIEDIQPLLTTDACGRVGGEHLELATNERIYNYPENKEVLYYIQSDITSVRKESDTSQSTEDYIWEYVPPREAQNIQRWPTALISHADANSFKQTYHNTPWIEYPKVYLEKRYVHVLFGVDDFTSEQMDQSILYMTYIKKPVLFTSLTTDQEKNQNFELSDNMAEELINQAIIMSLETIESSRLSSKISTSKLES